MTAAATLAHIICTGSLPVPGTVHDPLQPLVLGNQAANDYVVINWDAVNHRCIIQSVYQPPGGAIVNSSLTFAPDGTLLINNQPLSVAIPELAAAVSAAQAAAAASAASAATAGAAKTDAVAAASTAGSNASAAASSASDASLLANAPTGTPIPGGGDSAAVSRQKASQIAVVSRQLDFNGPFTADETFQAGFLETERRCNPTGLMTITLPPDIWTSGEKKARWAKYRLLSPTGSIKVVGAAGGTNLVAPTVVARGRGMKRWPTTGAGVNRTLVTNAVVPAITNGEILIAFHAAHNVNSVTLGLTLTSPGAPSVAWGTLVAYPTNPRAQWAPDWYVARAPLVAFAGGTIDITVLEGPAVGLQVCDWWAIEGVSGTAPLYGVHAGAGQAAIATAVISAVPAQSRLLASAAQIGAIGTVNFSSWSSNIGADQSGDTNGIDDASTSNTLTGHNEAYSVGRGVTTAAGDVTVAANFTASSAKPGLLAIAYHPKSVIGAGVMVLNKEGGRDTLSTQHGVMELWFQPDGVTVDVFATKP